MSTDGLIRLSDILRAEKAYDEAVADIEAHARSLNGMTHTVDDHGVRKLHLHPSRLEEGDHLRAKARARLIDWQDLKRRYFEPPVGSENPDSLLGAL